MRRISQFNMAMALAVAGVTGITMMLPVDAVHAQKKKKDQAPDYDIGKEYRAAYGEAQKAVQAEDFASAKTQAEAIVAMSQTPDEKYLAGQLLIQIGGKLSQSDLQLQGLKLSIDSGRLSETDAQKFNFYAGNLAFAANDFTSARKYLTEAIRLGYSEPDPDKDLGGILGEAYFKENMFVEGLAALEQSIARRQAGGMEVSENWFRRGASIAINNKLGAEASKWTKKWIAAYPSPSNWRDTLTVYKNGVSLGSQENLDIMRLMRRTDSLTSERDYAEYLEYADVRRLPGEVKTVLNEGQAKGNISTTTAFFAEQLQMANERVTEDRKSLPESERAAASSANGVTALATADAYLGYGDAAKAIPLYQTALSKGGVDADRANMRLAIAAADTGDYAMAKEYMAKVGGARAELASYWMIWLNQKAGMTAPAAATTAETTASVQ